MLSSGSANVDLLSSCSPNHGATRPKRFVNLRDRSRVHRAKRVIDSGRCSGLKGKTPEATISAMLAVGSKPGGPFKRVDKGTYTLADRATRPTNSSRTRQRGQAPDREAHREAAHAEAAGGEADRLTETEPRAAEAEREPLKHRRLSPLVRLTTAVF
jgi:hypothetical protein